MNRDGWDFCNTGRIQTFKSAPVSYSRCYCRVAEYFEYNTVTNVRMKSASSLQFPAFTICNHNMWANCRLLLIAYDLPNLDYLLEGFVKAFGKSVGYMMFLHQLALAFSIHPTLWCLCYYNLWQFLLSYRQVHRFHKSWYYASTKAGDSMLSVY